MVTKKRSMNKVEQKKGRVKVGKLKLKKETVKNLSGKEEKLIRGGVIRRTHETCADCPD